MAGSKILTTFNLARCNKPTTKIERRKRSMSTHSPLYIETQEPAIRETHEGGKKQKQREAVQTQTLRSKKERAQDPERFLIDFTIYCG